jgi:hypothetical protein
MVMLVFVQMAKGEVDDDMRGNGQLGQTQFMLVALSEYSTTSLGPSSMVFAGFVSLTSRRGYDSSID